MISDQKSEDGDRWSGGSDLRTETDGPEEDLLEKEIQKKVMEYQKLESECDKITAEILKMQTKVPLQTVTKSRSTSTGPSDDVRKKLREKRKKRKR